MPLPADFQSGPAIVTGKNIAVVQTESGAVRGYIHNCIYTFKGVPYGKAYRFMPAKKMPVWEGVRSCMAYGPTCPSNSYPILNDEFSFAFQRNQGLSDENCLNLNIWTAHTSKDWKRPVMVWLHGGGFSSGSSLEFPSLDGERLTQNGDVVVVSLNHRLNVLGFLDLSAYGEKYKYSANAGAMDMVAALTWVKDNIANFGGDAGNVTIFGQSGGGTKVMCLMNAPSAKGLFHKAIVQSGSSLSHITKARVSKMVSAELLKELNLLPNQVDTLQKLPYEVLATAGAKALTKVEKTLRPKEMPVFGLEWEPVHDGSFLPYQPNEMEAMALSREVPLLVGSCKNEFMPFMSGSKERSMDSVKVKIQQEYPDNADAYLAAVEKAYPETVKPSDFTDLDFLFRPLVIKHADQKASVGAAPVYVYLFTWQSPVLEGIFKAVHNMDLPFVFGNIQRCEELTGGGKEAYNLADKMSEAWIYFAKTGNPNHKGLPHWPGYSIQNGAVMILDNTCIVKYHHDKELLAIVKGSTDK